MKWLMLEPAERPSDAVAQQIIGTVLRDVYIQFAVRTAVIAAALLAGAVIVAAFGLFGTGG